MLDNSITIKRNKYKIIVLLLSRIIISVFSVTVSTGTAHRHLFPIKDIFLLFF